MPNHCENDLYISGSREDVAALLAFVGADQSPPKFDFDAILPYPEPFRSLDDEAEALRKEHGYGKGSELFREKHGPEASDGFNSGGYEWCRENWGTKWGGYEVVRRDYRGTCLTFQTAWSPAKKILPHLHRMFPNVTLSLEYFEQGMGYCGGVTFRAPDEYDDAPPVPPGTPSDEWQSDSYRGRRGG